jgi:hypothetical protein
MAQLLERLVCDSIQNCHGLQEVKVHISVFVRSVFSMCIGECRRESIVL